MKTITIKIDEKLKEKVETNAFNARMSVNEYVAMSLSSKNTLSIPKSAKKVKPIDGYQFIHEVDGKVLFKESGADAVSAYVGMFSAKETPEQAALDVGESLAAMLEACHYCQSGKFDYAKYRKK